MTVQNKQDVINLLEKCQGEICEFGVNRLGLFGSFVRNVAVLATGTSVAL